MITTTVFNFLNLETFNTVAETIANKHAVTQSQNAHCRYLPKQFYVFLPFV